MRVTAAVEGAKSTPKWGVKDTAVLGVSTFLWAVFKIQN